MTTRRSPATHEGAPTEHIRALGEAVLARSEDCWRRCEQQLAEFDIHDVGTADFRDRRRAAQLLGVQLFARWLSTGALSTVEEREWIGGLGELGARTDVSVAHMTHSHMIFRDVLGELIEEEGDRLGTPPDVLGRVRVMNARSCDSAILLMTRNFRVRKEHMIAATERLYAELVASEGRFRSVYDSIACGVVVVSPDGRVTGCNDAAAAMLELPAGELIGTNLDSATGPYKGALGDVLKRLPTAEAVATRQAIRGRVVKQDFGDGRPVRWHQVDAVPILGADGELAQVVSTIVDVTAVKMAEELREESAAKSRFLANMSHELRTPLNSILGFAQLLRRYESGQLDETQRRYVNNIETSGSHLLALISDILELSKVAAGQVVLTIEDVQVTPAVQLVAEEFEPMLAGVPVELRLDLRPGLVAGVDRLRFRQVVVNLLANALKFTEIGSVTVSTRKRSGQLEMRVVDTGIGIPPDQIDRVFDEFTQVDSGSTRTHGGTGLGLPLTRRLVEMMGGTFTLESVVGSGTTAVVLLPLTTG